MKAFLEYLSELSNKGPVKFKQNEYTIEVYIGKAHMDDIWKHRQYLYKEGFIRRTLNRNLYSFFFHNYIYDGTLRIRFI